MMPDIPPGFGLLRISGAKATPFLQGQLSCDLNSIIPDQPQLGAHCNPQGRVVSVFFLSLHDNEYYLTLPADMLEFTLKALKKYAVFFRVNMDIVLPPDMSHAEMQNQAYIKAGIPFIHPSTSGKCLPQELKLDTLGAISFDKGCYTGQEVIARLHYRGKVKSNLQSIAIQSQHLPLPGTLIHTGTAEAPQECGMIINASRINENDHIGLAVIDDSQLHNKLFLTYPTETITLKSGH